MKLLKLIPAAAIALTAFTIFEAKANKVCIENNGGFVMAMQLNNEITTEKKVSDYYSYGITKCIKFGDVPINVGDFYSVYYKIEASLYGVQACATDSFDQMSDTTLNYVVEGTTNSPKCKPD